MRDERFDPEFEIVPRDLARADREVHDVHRVVRRDRVERVDERPVRERRRLVGEERRAGRLRENPFRVERRGERIETPDGETSAVHVSRRRSRTRLLHAERLEERGDVRTGDVAVDDIGDVTVSAGVAVLERKVFRLRDRERPETAVKAEQRAARDVRSDRLRARLRRDSRSHDAVESDDPRPREPGRNVRGRGVRVCDPAARFANRVDRRTEVPIRHARGTVCVEDRSIRRRLDCEARPSHVLRHRAIRGIRRRKICDELCGREEASVRLGGRIALGRDQGLEVARVPVRQHDRDVDALRRRAPEIADARQRRRRDAVRGGGCEDGGVGTCGRRDDEKRRDERCGGLDVLHLLPFLISHVPFR